MKNTTLRVLTGGAVALLLAAGMSSCGNGCYECVKGYDTDYYCRDSYPNNKTYQAAVKEAKAWGYKCRKQ